METNEFQALLTDLAYLTMGDFMEKPSVDEPLQVNPEVEEILWQLIAYRLQKAREAESIDQSSTEYLKGWREGTVTMGRQSALDLVVLLTGRDEQELAEVIGEIAPDNVNELANR